MKSVIGIGDEWRVLKLFGDSEERDGERLRNGDGLRQGNGVGIELDRKSKHNVCPSEFPFMSFEALDR